LNKSWYNHCQWVHLHLQNLSHPSGYTKIYSTGFAFAALKADGSITSWGYVGTAPSGNGYTKIYSNQFAFAALKADGSITAWGGGAYGGSDAPTSKGTPS
jgi:hypothetical protein